MQKERAYPFGIALVFTFAAWVFNINYISDNRLFEALNGILTVTTLIIGFWGAVFPLVLNAKNEIKAVKRVFDIDKNGLYYEYMYVMLLSGMFLIITTVSAYFRDSYLGTIYYKSIFYILVFLFVFFICATFRCLSITIHLVFLNNNISEDDTVHKRTELIERFEEELKNTDEYK